MNLLFCFSLPLFSTIVETTPVRAQRENVLSFLNDALGTATEKSTPATVTAYKIPPSKPVKEQDSEDLSEAKSTESFNTNGFTDAFKDRYEDSYEIMISKVVDKDRAPLRRKTGGDQDNMRSRDMSSRPVQDQGSREQSGPQGGHQASREQIDLNSEEDTTVDAQGLSGIQVSHVSGDLVTKSASRGRSLQRKASPGRVSGLNGMSAPGRSREVLDWDSLEDINARPAPVGNRGDTDYDETRELISAETYPTGALAPPDHMPSSLSVPAKSRAS